MNPIFVKSLNLIKISLACVSYLHESSEISSLTVNTLSIQQLLHVPLEMTYNDFQKSYDFYEIAYILDEQYWGRGIATQVAQELLHRQRMPKNISKHLIQYPALPNKFTSCGLYCT